MTPLDCARGLAKYLKRCFDTYDEIDSINGEQQNKPINTYAGFLPRVSTTKDMLKICPAVVVRPELVDDSKDNSKTTIVIYVTVYDHDFQHGSDSLYHLLEFVRFSLLSQNPVDDKYQIIGNAMKMTIPDGQPFPQWLGTIEFDVYLPQPVWTPPNVIGVEPWRRKKQVAP